MEKKSAEAERILRERFGRDSVVALATTEGGLPDVRCVNAYYENDAFYVVTYARSNRAASRACRGLVHRARRSGGHRLLRQRRKP